MILGANFTGAVKNGVFWRITFTASHLVSLYSMPTAINGHAKLSITLVNAPALVCLMVKAANAFGVHWRSLYLLLEFPEWVVLISTIIPLYWYLFQYHQRLLVLDNQIQFFDEKSLESIAHWLQRWWYYCQQKKRAANEKLTQCNISKDVLRAEWAAQISEQTKPAPRALIRSSCRGRLLTN